MKTETKEIYKCEYCNKLYQIKTACINHEKSCNKRPDYIRPCHSCRNIGKVKEVVWSGYGDQNGEEVERVVSVLFCSKIDSFIYPPSVAAKGNAFDMGDNNNIEMPKQCDLYEEEDLTGYFTS